jgi:hypothetical protein
MSNNNNIFLIGKSGKLVKFGSEMLPLQTVSKQSDWVIFGNKDGWQNQQPQYYESLYRLSSKNNAILKTKNRYVYGKGFELDRSERYKIRDTQRELETISFVNKVEGSRTFKRLISDYNLFGGFACEMIPSKDGKTVTPHFIPFKNIRVSKDVYNKDGSKEPTEYYYTSDWSKGKRSSTNEDFETFAEFDWGLDKFDSSKRYLLYFKDEGYEDDYYPLPSYVGGIPYIDADTEVGNFVYNNVKNGFTAGFFVEFYDGEPTHQQKAEIEQMWKNSFHGTSNAGGSVLNFADQAGDSTKITPLSDNGQDDRYINLNNQIREEVFTAHTVSPLAVGMKGDSGFANNADERRVAVEMFKSDFVSTAQEPFNDFMNELLSYNGLAGKVYLEDLDPIRGEASEATLLQIATTDELRQIYGFPKQTLESNPVADAIGTISPLVATKVLDTMTAAEVRGLVGLATAEGVTKTTETILTKYKDEVDNIIASQFEQCGILDAEFEVLDSFELCATDSKDAAFQSVKFRLDKFATSLENSILKYLIVDPKITNKTLSTLLDKSVDEIDVALKNMFDDGLINEDNEPQEQPEDEIFTVYKYEKRSDVSGASVKETTRPFCRRLVAQSLVKSWTIQDINRMNNGMGLDVFSSRGGWRTLEGTNRHVPFCRHVWKSYLVRRK